MTISPLFIGANATAAVAIQPRMANRHGLIAGATGTGKTITLQVLAQAFSQQGVPVLVPDIKGDFSGIAKPGVVSEKLQQRAQRVGGQTRPTTRSKDRAANGTRGTASHTRSANRET